MLTSHCLQLQLLVQLPVQLLAQLLVQLLELLVQLLVLPPSGISESSEASSCESLVGIEVG